MSVNYFYLFFENISADNLKTQLFDLIYYLLLSFQRCYPLFLF